MNLDLDRLEKLAREAMKGSETGSRARQPALR